MLSSEPVREGKKRGNIPKHIRTEVLERANNKCEFPGCCLKEGDIDPISGGKVKLQVDHINPHASFGDDDISNYQALCPRHQVKKKNFYAGKDMKPDLRVFVNNAGKKEKMYKGRHMKKILVSSCDCLF